MNRACSDLPRDARKTIVVQKFIHGLDDIDLQRHVHFRHPSTVDQATSFAAEFVSFQTQCSGQSWNLTSNDTSIRGTDKKLMVSKPRYS